MLKRLKRLGPDLNAYTCSFDPGLLAGLRASYARELLPALTDPAHRAWFEGGYYHSERVGPYHLVSYDTYPLLWLSNDGPETYSRFRRFFDGLGIAADMRQLVDTRRRIVMYAGFFVIGDRAPEPMWHYDYRPGANAYTLIAPLAELAPTHGHLCYETRQGHRERYRYRPGEAIIFGEGFLHSTEPYQPAEGEAGFGPIRALVSMTFGTDKWEHWDVLKQNIEEQSRYYVLPCGHAAGACGCRERYERGGWWRFWG